MLNCDDLYPDPPDDLDLPSEPDFDCEPEAWKKCGACPTLIPNRGVGSALVSKRHRWLNGKELCSACTDEVTDAEQEADEENRRRAEENRAEVAWERGR